MRVSCQHWSVKIGAVFFIQERRTKMGKRDKEIPYEVVIQERKRVEEIDGISMYLTKVYVKKKRFSCSYVGLY